jgi:hypothetical protein
MKRVLIACATILAGSMGGYATEAPAFSDINIIFL